jgi:hypothetical protein
MTKHAADTNRRRFVKLTVTGLAAAPFTNALLSGSAEAVDMVSESDPTAVALKYKMDATKAPDRKDATALCSNCSFYTAKPGDANGPLHRFRRQACQRQGLVRFLGQESLSGRLGVLRPRAHSQGFWSDAAFGTPAHHWELRKLGIEVAQVNVGQA